MRNLKKIALLATLALGGAAYAATSGTATIGATSTGEDTLTVTGNATAVNFANVDFGTTKSAGSSALAYQTQNINLSGPRDIAVKLVLGGTATALPDGVSIKLTIAAGNVGGTGVTGGVTFTGTVPTTNTNLITGIAAGINNGAATVDYGITATKSFVNFSGTLTYTIGQGL